MYSVVFEVKEFVSVHRGRELMWCVCGGGGILFGPRPNIRNLQYNCITTKIHHYFQREILVD